MKLTEHFTLAEFERSATAARLHIDNRVPAELVPNTRNLCEQVLEPLRLVPDSTSAEARQRMREWAEWIMDNCPFDQLLRERRGNSFWIHVSLRRAGRNRQMVSR